MDHSEAMRLKAPEKYMLGELGGDMRDQFEEHFMSCAECARDVRAGVMFVESAREVLSSEAPESARAKSKPGPAGGWFGAFFRPMIAAPALAILLAIVAYQAAVTIPHLESAVSKANSPRTLASFSLINQNSRGGAPVPFAVQQGEPFALYVDVPPQPSFPMYEIEVESASGALQFAVPISAEEARNTVQLLIPPSRLAPGQYLLVIRGTLQSNTTGGAEVARFGFALETR